MTIVCSTAGVAAGERRVALVIGNGAYTDVQQLPDPQQDAEAIGTALRNVGFTKVTVLKDVTHEKLRVALRSFSAESETSDWSVLYYAGHGIEVGGKNYLIPVDAHLATDRDVEFEAIPMQTAEAAVQGARKLRLIILDACRDDPFLNKMKRSSGVTRSLARGLARMDPEGDLFIAYAAQSGQVADDGEGRSPFATSLLKNIETPGLEINLLFRRVHREVMNATRNRQEPQFDGNLPSEELFFKPPAASPAVARVEPRTDTPREPDRSPGSSVAQAAAAGLAPLPVTVPATLPAAPALPVPSRTGMSPAPRTADLEPPPSARVVAEPAPTPPSPQETAVAIKDELHRVGCEPGTQDGDWTNQSRAALREFARRTSLQLPSDEPTPEALGALRIQRGLICPPVVKAPEVPHTPVVTAPPQVAHPQKPAYVAPRHFEPPIRQPTPKHEVVQPRVVQPPPKREVVQPRVVPPPRREVAQPRIVQPAPIREVVQPRYFPPPKPEVAPRRTANIPDRFEEPRAIPEYRAPRPPRRRVNRDDDEAAPRPARRRRASSGGSKGCFVFNGQSVCD